MFFAGKVRQLCIINYQITSLFDGLGSNGLIETPVCVCTGSRYVFVFVVGDGAETVGKTVSKTEVTVSKKHTYLSTYCSSIRPFTHRSVYSPHPSTHPTSHPSISIYLPVYLPNAQVVPINVAPTG